MKNDTLRCGPEVTAMVVEEEEEANEEKEAGPNAVVKVFRFVMKQSYVCALIAMMVSISLATASGPN